MWFSEIQSRNILFPYRCSSHMRHLKFDSILCLLIVDILFHKSLKMIQLHMSKYLNKNVTLSRFAFRSARLRCLRYFNKLETRLSRWCFMRYFSGWNCWSHYPIPQLRRNTSLNDENFISCSFHQISFVWQLALRFIFQIAISATT